MEDKLKQGETLFAEGKVEEAEKCFLGLLEENPENEEAYNNLGVIALQRQNIEQAFAYFTKALEIAPFYKYAVLNYSEVLRALGRLHAAIPILEKGIEKYSDDKEVNQLLQDAYEAQYNSTPLTDSLNHKTHLKSKELINSSPEKKFSGTNEDPLSGKKILHAPFEIAGNMARISRFLRAQNVDAISANYYDSWLKYKCDINLNINNLPESERHKTIDDFAKEAIDKYDIFHFHFTHSLYPDFRDLEELKQKGKKILFSFWGSDQRSPEWILYHQAKFLGYNPPKPFFNTLQQYHTHKLINRYADVMFGTTCIPRGIFIPGYADTSEWNLVEKERMLRRRIIEKDSGKTYFVHAPTSHWKKGSQIILKLLEECKKDGMPIEILFVSQVPPERAKQIYAYADYGIDHVGVGTFGLFGVEMLCWQTPVLVYHIDLFDRIRNSPPIIRITKDNFKSQIAKCIEMKESGEIVELGKKGQKWAIENVDISLGLPEYLRIYRNLVEGKQIKQYVNRSWYEQEYRLQSGVKSKFYRYMIEENVFDELQMQAPDYDRRLYT
ncbi:MAG: tetratricopeptide repeat protein [Desulfobacterales bacterium]|nr:tetratricopeptide repeat protein [Desulfobacterales bacterium]